MKIMKKISALVIAMVMVLVLGLPAMAGEETEPEAPATITIQNGEYGSYYTRSADEINYSTHTYKAAQILKAESYDAATSEYRNLTWGAQVTDSGALLTALKADTTWGTVFANYVTAAENVDNTHPLFTAASFASAISTATSDQAKALAQVLKGLYANQGQEISGTEPVTLLDGIGYYLIDDVTTGLTNDAANPVTLFAAPGQNKIQIKVDKPSQDKQVKENEAAKTTAAGLDTQWNEVSDYSIGDAVPYQILSKVPNVENFKDYTMKFTDTMSDGLTLFDNWTGVVPSNTTAAAVKVTVGETDVTANATITKNDHGFVLTLPIKTAGTQATWATAGATITIEFFGVLNQNAEIGLNGNTNKSKLEYSNNPDDDKSTTETPEDTVITFTYELDVNKIDGATEAALPGAQFALKATDGEHSGKYAVVNASGKIVKWQDTAPAADQADDADGLNALLTSDKDGNFNVTGIDDGKYSLEEIKAPAGYNKIDPIALEVIAGTVHTADGEDAAEALTDLDITAGGKTVDGSIETGIVNTTVENNSGSTLPSTGGIGTTIFYVIGGILVVLAGVVLVTKRKSAE